VSGTSPWWYRSRGSLILAVYVLGFVVAYSPLGGRDPQPVSAMWGNGALLWVAVAAALVAWACRASGTAYLRRDVVFADDVQSDALIVAGPFRYVRNPLYLGNMFLAFAVAMLAPPIGAAIILIGNAAVVALLAAEESRELAQHFGAAYEAFRAAVPSFVPRFTAAVVPGTITIEPAWGSGLLGEAFCLAFAIAIVPLALFGHAGLPAFWAICAAAFVLFSLLGWLAGRRRRS